MSEIAYVSALPPCDFCDDGTPATHDVKTLAGPWASVCDLHRTTRAATMQLGLGLGQRYSLEAPPPDSLEDRKLRALEAAQSMDLEGFFEAVGDGDPADFL